HGPKPGSTIAAGHWSLARSIAAVDLYCPVLTATRSPDERAMSVSNARHQEASRRESNPQFPMLPSVVLA
ncbi:MAG: hypothetical protein ACK58T_40950, partial [Phycisphaerae bacterium]